jgi:hypothetical protein
VHKRTFNIISTISITITITITSRSDPRDAARSMAPFKRGHLSLRCGKIADNQPHLTGSRQQIANAIPIVVTFNFRFGAHNGLKSDVAPCPERANGLNRSRGRALRRAAWPCQQRRERIA